MAHFVNIVLAGKEEGRCQCGDAGEGPPAGMFDVVHIPLVLTWLIFQLIFIPNLLALKQQMNETEAEKKVPVLTATTGYCQKLFKMI